MNNNGKSTLCDITAQVDMNLIVVCENMELTAVKRKSEESDESDESDDDDDEQIIKILGGWCQLLTLFWRSLSRHIICFPDVRSLVEPVARIEEIHLYCSNERSHAHSVLTVLPHSRDNYNCSTAHVQASNS